MLLLVRKLPQSGARLVAAIVATAFLYILTARLGLMLAMADGVVTAVWPPSGVALAALLIFGRRVWFGVWIGSFIANLWPLLSHTPSPGIVTELLASAIFASGSLGAAWLATWALERALNSAKPISGVRHIAMFLFYGGVLGCLISSSVGATTLCVSGLAPMAALPGIFMTWWMGDALGVFLFTPAILVWAQGWNASGKTKVERTRVGETVLCYVTLTVLAWLVFKDPSPRFFGGLVLLPLIVWAALRLGYRGLTPALIPVGIIAIWGTAHGCGPYAMPSLNDSMLSLDLFIFCIVTTGLCIAAVVEERQAAEAALSLVNQGLEERVTARTRELNEIAEQLRDSVAGEIHAADALRKSQARLNIATSASKIGYWDWNLVTNELEISPEWLAQIGYDHDESLKLSSNRAWRERLHPDDVDKVLSLTNAHLESPANDYAAEFRLRHNDGSYRNIYSRGKCVLDEHGKPERLIGCHVDVTELRQAEKSATLFRTLVDKVNDSIEVIDPETGRFLDGNSGWCQEHGYTREEMLKMTVLDVSPGFDEAQYHRNLVNVKASGSAVFESVHRRKDGSEFPVEVSANYVRTDRDYLLVVLRNITARKRAEEDFRNHSERLRLAVDVAQLGTWDWDFGTNKVTSDERLRVMFSGSQAVRISEDQEFRKFIHPDDAPAVDKAIQDAIAGADHFHSIFRVVWTDGSTHWLEGRGSVFRDTAGKPIRMVGVTADITGQRYNEQLVQKYSQLSLGKR